MKRMLSSKRTWAAAALVLSILIVAVGFAFGMRGGVLAAFSLGAILSSALAIGLMALIFYSSRSGYDDSVQGLTKGRD